ncbi:hypothetical protein PMAL9190_01930 [Photobacterium malacitanum]|uniref:Uncharacterized protein n=1 Tax=Photobacterium malacitanum TaxID=2204294 RepID=A0A1Y6MG26_9GAMM|nr:hypothetical protein PMAL9190_01930 [Photobacterium malacitanum]
MKEPVTKIQYTAPIALGIMLFFISFLTFVLPLSK